MFTRVSVCLWMLQCVASTHADVAIDEGYELLFRSETTEVRNTCFRTAALPHWLQGSFLFAAVGQLEVGVQKFVNVLDGFGKLHRFDIKPESSEICFSARMMDTAFFNKSMASNEIAPSVLFNEPVPPRTGINPLRNIMGPNDNVIINSVEMGKGKYVMVTDSPTSLDFDPRQLHMLGKHQWTDKTVRVGNMGMLGSGHPLRWTGDARNRLLELVVEAPYVSVGQKGPLAAARVDILAVADEDPTKRVLVNSFQPPKGYIPYFHSFGATKNYVVLPLQACTLSFGPLEAGRPMSEAFKPFDARSFVLLPLDGSPPIKFNLSSSIAYAHNVNAFENASGVVFDVSTFNVNNPFHTNFTQIPTQENKTERDAEPTRAQIERFVFHLDPDDVRHPRGSVTSQVLTLSPRAEQGQVRYQEFPRIDDAQAGHPYNFYYAIEWFHDDKTKGAMAIVKQRVPAEKETRGVAATKDNDYDDNATGTSYWYRRAFFPGEAIFVPSNREDRREDDGVLLFVSLAGAEMEQHSHFHIVNATTMTDIVDLMLPVRIPYQAHGQFFAGPSMFNNTQERF